MRNIVLLNLPKFRFNKTYGSRQVSLNDDHSSIKLYLNEIKIESNSPIHTNLFFEHEPDGKVMPSIQNIINIAKSGSGQGHILSPSNDLCLMKKDSELVVFVEGETTHIPETGWNVHDILKTKIRFVETFKMRRKEGSLFEDQFLLFLFHVEAAARGLGVEKIALSKNIILYDENFDEKDLIKEMDYFLKIYDFRYVENEEYYQNPHKEKELTVDDYLIPENDPYLNTKFEISTR